MLTTEDTLAAFRMPNFHDPKLEIHIPTPTGHLPSSARGVGALLHQTSPVSSIEPVYAYTPLPPLRQKAPDELSLYFTGGQQTTENGKGNALEVDQSGTSSSMRRKLRVTSC